MSRKAGSGPDQPQQPPQPPPKKQARRALTEAERLGPEEKLRLSLFGQLRAKMSGWDDRALRRAYVHMQVRFITHGPETTDCNTLYSIQK